MTKSQKSSRKLMADRTRKYIKAGPGFYYRFDKKSGKNVQFANRAARKAGWRAKSA